MTPDETEDLPHELRSESPRIDREKARRAARHPGRPGQECRAAPATFVPEIDHNRCEGKADCVAVCPYDVFEVRRIDPIDAQSLSMLGRLKSFVHGGKTAYAPRAAQCQACGLCVVACPERAIKLARAGC